MQSQNLGPNSGLFAHEETQQTPATLGTPEAEESRHPFLWLKDPAMTIQEEFETLVEATIRTELFVRPNQSPGEAARGITYELIQRMRAHHLNVTYRSSFTFDDEDEYEEDD